MMYPFEFDPREWQHKCGDPRHRSVTDRNFITSPVDVIREEAQRAQHKMHCGAANAVPAEVFVFAKGEPDRSWVTKVGGTPYRPKKLPWPCYQDASSDSSSTVLRPMTFLAQFCFAGSRDLVTATPGDILLVFAKNNEMPSEGSLHFEWHSLGIDDLIHSGDVPSSGWKVPVCYGHRYRTCDFDDPESDPDPPWVVRAMKIGGLPSLPDYAYAHADTQSRFICQLVEVAPVTEMPFPWVNAEEALDDRELYKEGAMLSIGDAGALCLFLTPDGEVIWEYST